MTWCSSTSASVATMLSTHTRVCSCLSVNSLRPRLNRRPLADDIFKCIFLNENELISSKISLKFVPRVQINNIPALVQIMAWRRPGDKPLSGPMMASLLTHICVTRPQWVKGSCALKIYVNVSSHIMYTTLLSIVPVCVTWKCPVNLIMWRNMMLCYGCFILYIDHDHLLRWLGLKKLQSNHENTWIDNTYRGIGWKICRFGVCCHCENDCLMALSDHSVKATWLCLLREMLIELRPRQLGRHFADVIFKLILLYEYRRVLLFKKLVF